MYYVVAQVRRGLYMASVREEPAEVQRLHEALQREGIPSFFGQAADVGSADPRLRQALGFAKE